MSNSIFSSYKENEAPKQQVVLGKKCIQVKLHRKFVDNCVKIILAISFAE